MTAEAERKQPLDFDELFPSRFLKAGELRGKRVTLTIASVDLEDLVDEDGEERTKGVLSFSETNKQLVVNKSNGIFLRAMFGREVQAWVQKRITLHAAIWNSEPCVRIFGSPDIPHDIQHELRLPRRKPIPVTLRRTGQTSSVV